MAARALTYKLGSLSYANSKVQKPHREDGLAFFKPSLWQASFLDTVPFSAGTNGELNNSSSF